MLTASELLFGEVKVDDSSIFYLRKHVFAFVNERPLIEGHIVIAPTKQIRRLKELSEVEMLELMFTIKSISANLKKFYNTSSVAVQIQDGKEAGQVINHLCVHIYPITVKTNYKDASATRVKLSKTDIDKLAKTFEENFVFK